MIQEQGIVENWYQSWRDHKNTYSCLDCRVHGRVKTELKKLQQKEVQGVEWSGESLSIVTQEVLEIRESAHLAGLPDWSPKHKVSHDKSEFP